MKLKIILLFVLSLVALRLELLPFGVVLRFGNPDGEPFVETFSYFDLTPFGYANFGPLITAILTCVIILLLIICWINKSQKLLMSVTIISGLSILSSLLPLILFGPNYLTVVSILITVFLTLIFLISLFENFDE